MRKLGEAIQGVKVPGAIEISPAMKLHQRLERVGAYERLRQLDPRRATLLQTYLTTEKSIADAGKEAGLQSRTQAHQLIHSSLEVAFFALPEQERAEYGNDPTNALRLRTAQQTQAKSERIKEAHDRRRNSDTGKVEISATQRLHVTEANQRRGKQIRERTYTGRPVGRPRKNVTT